jgi:uroporphyrin-III C-methyltransferase/precorrin-2 dehydrogenase/sirohydrochlorin ferrochelatase
LTARNDPPSTGSVPHRKAAPILPVALLLEGKPCLVVGGGAVAAHKARLLLDAGAQVTIVAPEIAPALQRLAGRERLVAIRRRFRAGDLRRRVLVFAATDNPGVNAAVLVAARRARILASISDAQWRDGDFITPAILKNKSITVAVSTGGRSCRTARDVRDRIARLLDDLAEMQK